VHIAVLGAGAGGLALAHDAAARGHAVRLFDLPEFPAHIAAVQAAGGVTLVQDGQSSLQPVTATHDCAEALAGAEAVFAVTPAFGTRPMAEAARPHLQPGVTVVVCPGSGGGALEFKAALGLGYADPSITVGEAHTLPYAVRATAPGVATLFHRVDRLIVGAVPSARTAQAVDALAAVIAAPVTPARNVLETTLIDGNPVIHPPITVCNAALIQRTGGDFEFYAEGITDAVADLMQAVDEERLALARAFGLDLPSEPEMSCREGYIDPAQVNYRLGYKTSPGFAGIKAQAQLEHRYLTEDVGYVMVFWTTLAELAGVATPVMDALVTLTSALLGRDLRAGAPRTAARLQLTPEVLRDL
jgi:opine dehydrogenase